MMGSVGKIAYDAYCKQTGGKSLISGDTLPGFYDLKQEIREAWDAAAYAVRDFYAVDADK